MKTIKTVLPTGVITTHNQEGRIKVELKDYDTYFDLPTLESECANNTQLLLSNMLKDLH